MASIDRLNKIVGSYLEIVYLFYWVLMFHDVIISQASRTPSTNGTLHTLYLPWILGYSCTIHEATYLSLFLTFTLFPFFCLSILCLLLYF
jgi:hypothetical protein